MDIREEAIGYFGTEKPIYKFIGNIYELQDIVREPIPMLSADNIIYFTVHNTPISLEDSRFSIFVEARTE
jgi:hypothetical protein